MTAKHTPGPWMWDGRSLRPTNPNPDESLVHTILEVEAFAYGFMGHHYESVRDGIHAEDELNRRLIAAAPDLLEALYTALPFVEDAMFDDCYKRSRVTEAIRVIKAAVAKAEGVSS